MFCINKKINEIFKVNKTLIYYYLIKTLLTGQKQLK